MSFGLGVVCFSVKFPEFCICPQARLERVSDRSTLVNQSKHHSTFFTIYNYIDPNEGIDSKELNELDFDRVATTLQGGLWFGTPLIFSLSLLL